MRGQIIPVSGEVGDKKKQQVQRPGLGGGVDAELERTCRDQCLAWDGQGGRDGSWDRGSTGGAGSPGTDDVHGCNKDAFPRTT